MFRTMRNLKLRRRGVGALPVLAGVLMASGLVRMGDGSGSEVFAQFGALAARAATAPIGEATAPDDEIAVILAALKDRETQLDKREDRLGEREAKLTDFERKVRAQMDELETAEQNLSQLLKLAKSAAEDDLNRLTAVYESMAPKDAAALFSEMSPIFAAGFLARMRSESAAAILAGLEPATAYSISVMIAGRNAEVPTVE